MGDHMGRNSPGPIFLEAYQTLEAAEAAEEAGSCQDAPLPVGGGGLWERSHGAAERPETQQGLVVRVLEIARGNSAVQGGWILAKGSNLVRPGPSRSPASQAKRDRAAPLDG